LRASDIAAEKTLGAARLAKAFSDHAVHYSVEFLTWLLLGFGVGVVRLTDIDR
jgi:hypothetical protein